MKNLNQFWMMLIVSGFLILLASAAWNLSQSFSGADNEFDEKITPFEANVLIPKFVEEHITEQEGIIDSIL